MNPIPSTPVHQDANRPLIDDSPDCVKVLDLDGRLLSVNAAGMRVLEICDPEQFIGNSWLDFWNGKDREAAQHAVSTARNSNIGRFIGFFPTTQTRRPMWFDVVVSPILDDSGKPEKLLAISRDVTEWKRQQDLLHAILDGTSVVVGREFFQNLVEHIAKGLRVRWAFVAECLPDRRARSLAYWADGKLVGNFEYNLENTPCMEVAQGRICHIPDHLARAFPHDKSAVERGIQSYLGVPLRDSERRVIGHLVIFDDKPMVRDPLTISVLETFASRAGVELERTRAFEQIAALKAHLQEENIYLQEEIRNDHNFNEIVGRSSALLDVFKTIDQVAPTDSTILIQGETGTGKELLARAIHSRSSRHERVLVKVNCAAISAGLVESELFGHVKGAFTGALSDREGRFKVADGGTIFLDEIGELSLDTQVKLLRVLQEREFEPVGSSKTIRVNVRIIAATSRDLIEQIKLGKFRSELFYRLNVVPLRVPALRERAEDVPLLVAFFLQKYATAFGKPTTRFDGSTMQRLKAYHWPGNIRELQNVIERAVVLSNGGVIILGSELFGPITESTRTIHPSQKLAEPATTPPVSRALKSIEREHIESVLRQCDWVIEGEKGAANILSLNPSTLRSRMQKLGIKRP